MEIKLFNNTEVHQSNKEVVSFIKSNTRSNYDTSNFLWQYKSDLSVFGVIQEGELVFGTQGMMAVDLIYNGNLFYTHKSETTFLSEATRGKGLFEKLYNTCVNECKEKGTRFIWGFTALSKVWRRKLGFHVAENLIYESEVVISAKQQWHVFTESKRSFNGFLKLMYFFFKGMKFRIKSIFVNEKITKDVQITPSLNLEFDISRLLLKIEPYKQFYALNYSVSFIESRLFSSPINKYNSLVLYKESEPFAILIYTLNRGVFRISECLYADETSLAQLFTKIVKLAISLKQSKIAFWGNYYNPIYNKVFEIMKDYGSKTLSCKDMNFVMLNCTEIENNQYDNLHNWLINGLWTEGYSY